VVSEIEEVSGTDPVRSTIIIPRVNNVSPKEREKYCSRAATCELRKLGLIG